MVDSDKPRRKVFALPEKVGNRHSSIEFAIGEEEFKCRPTLGSMKLLKFAELASILGGAADDESSVDPAVLGEAAGSIRRLLSDTIIDFDRFEKFVDDNDVDIDMLGEIAGWIVEAYTDRPQQRP